MYGGRITDVPGILVGNVSDFSARTGVTAILPEGGARAGVDVRGGGPGTRETDALAPGRLVEKLDAVLLCGGSAFGLDAAGGAMRWLEAQGRGYQTGFARVPIVSAAVIYDLGVGDGRVRPDEEMGARACECAGRDFEQGAVGAGCGATVGKLAPGARPGWGGLGSAALALPGGAVIGALAVVNAAGDVYDPDTGAFLSGGRDAQGEPLPAIGALLAAGQSTNFAGNTTLGVIATDAKLDSARLQRLAMMAHDGFARAIRPVHLPVDGDTAFALSTGEKEVDYILLCAAAAEVMARAIANAVTAPGGRAAAP